MEPFSLAELKQMVEERPNRAVEYGLVQGFVYPLGDALKSQFTDDKGPIKHFKRILHKSERHRGYW